MDDVTHLSALVLNAVFESWCIHIQFKANVSLAMHTLHIEDRWYEQK